MPYLLFLGWLTGLTWGTGIRCFFYMLIHALCPLNQQPAIRSVRCRRPLRRGVRCRRPRSLTRGSRHPRPGGSRGGQIFAHLFLGRVQVLLKQNCIGMNSGIMQGFWWGPQTLGTYGLLNQEAAGRVKPAAVPSCPASAANAASPEVFFLAGAMRTSSL